MKPPIIIGGCARSGTTLLLSILAAHPNIYAIPEETGVFAGQGGCIGDYLPANLDKRWCEKTPMNVHRIEETFSSFNGEVKFINIVRDGRDVVTSIHPKKPKQFWVSPERWCRDVDAGYKFDLLNPGKMLTVKYEWLVCEFSFTIKKILQYIEEDFVSELLAWPLYTSIKIDSAWFGPVKDFYTNSICRWKDHQYAERVKEFMNHPGAAELLQRYGYESV